MGENPKASFRRIVKRGSSVEHAIPDGHFEFAGQASDGRTWPYPGLTRLLRQVGSRGTRAIFIESGSERRRNPAVLPPVERLETRLALSAAVSVVMDSATTTDSKSVTIDYNLPVHADAQHPLTFGVFRSTESMFTPDDMAIGSETIVPSGEATPTLDDDGQMAAAAGHHRLTIPIPLGLTLNPEHPYVLVVANPDGSSAGLPPSTASFRKYTIGVIVHGGLQDKSSKNGPAWELNMGRSLKEQGYDAVIPYNWVAQSSTPGAAAKQGPRLARMVLEAANQAPANEPIDLHFIGHSEGAVIDTLAIDQLEKNMTPQMKAGYLEDTLLDPHAANNSFTGRQYSVSGILGPLASLIIKGYQARAEDPLASVPAGVDQAEVFYQHTQATSSGIDNLWGQVPVRGSASYFNLTVAGATHSGNTGVAAWYQANIVPTLGDGAPGLSAQTLTGGLEPGEAKGVSGADVVGIARPSFAGSAGPGSIVRLFAGPASDPAAIGPVGRTVADADGKWFITTRSLNAGAYRVVAVSTPAGRARPHSSMKPTAPLGELVVDSHV